MITEEIKKEIKEYALSMGKEECCGFIVSCDGEKKVIKCKNNSINKETNFLISPRDYLYAKHVGKIEFIFHSQYGVDDFSDQDKINSEGHKLPSILYVTDKDIFKEYFPQNYLSPYIGRKFVRGEQDCLTLLVDYYKNELRININLPSDVKDEEFFKKNRSGISYKDKNNFFTDNGFEKVWDGAPNIFFLQKNDILLMKCPNSEVPSHIAIYLGNSYVLHQTRSAYSEIVKVTDVFLSKVCFVARHQSL